VPGRHNVLNATAAVAIAISLKFPRKKSLKLSHFRGVDRRFQHRGAANGITVVDDYGHHPPRFAQRWPPPANADTKDSVVFQLIDTHGLSI